MAKETFKTVEGFDQYLVSNTGRVISIKHKAKELKPQKDAVGYYHVRLYPEDRRFGSYGKGRGKRPKLYKVHKLVAETFIPMRVTGERLEINHKNGDKSDNRVKNLEWVTRQENMAHSYATGLHNGAAYKAAMKRRRPCYAEHLDGRKEYFESRVHAAIALNTTPFTVTRSILDNKRVSRYAAKGYQFFNLDELPPGETFKQILNIEKKLIELNDRWFPNRKNYMKKWNDKRRDEKKLKK